MANVRTNLLARGSRAGPYWNTIYTGPAQVTTIVKHVSLTNAGGSTAGVLLIGSSSGADATLLSLSLAAAASSNTAQYWVLRPGDRLILRYDVAVTYHWWISGSQLAGVAPSLPQGPLVAEVLPAQVG